MSVQISLTGKTAIVTGAARGIGFAIAEMLSQAGASVLLADIDKAQLQSAAEKVKRSAMVAGDLTDRAIPERIVDAAIEHFGSIDIIVNNAGYTWDNVIQKTTDEQFETMLNIHAVAPFRLLRAASTWLRDTAKAEAEQGSRITRKVVNITSITGLDGNAGQVAYSTAKSAIVGFTKTLAKEWGRYNVTVNSVGFGLIETRLTKPMSDAETAIAVGDKQIQVGMRESAREEVLKSIPLGRFGTPIDAAKCVFFFCSPLSDYVSGEVLVCGGGLRF